MKEYEISQENQLDSILISTKELKFTFNFPPLTKEENEYWTEKVKANYFACGCDTGKYFLTFSFLTTLFFLIYVLTFQRIFFNINLIISSIVFVFLMAGIGKFVGKKIALVNLKKDIIKLKTLITEVKPTNDITFMNKMVKILVD